MITLQTAENALKNVYLGTITDIINTKINPLMTKIQATASDVWGKEIHTAARVGINGGFGAGGEVGPLPEAQGNSYLQFVTTLKNLYGKIEISDKAIRAGVEGAGAFTDILNSEIEGLVNACKFNFGRMLYGDGTGLLSTVSNVYMPNYTVSNVNNFVPGMLIDVYSPTNTLLYSKVRVDAILPEESRIVIRYGINDTLEDGCKFYVQGSKNNELTGIGAIFNSSASTLYGVDKFEHPEIEPFTKKLNGGFSETTLEEVIDMVENKSNSTINFISASSTAKYAYQEFMAQYKRNIDVMKLDGGFTSISYNGIPFVYDRFVKEGEMYLLDTDKFKLHQLCDWRFLENSNGKILHQKEDKPVYSATLVKYCDLVCCNPAGQARITNITRA